jgi:hypothetical protein
MKRAVAVLIALTLLSCGPHKSQTSTAPGISGGAQFDPTVGNSFSEEGKDVFVIQVAADGKIYRNGIEVTEDELKQEALLWFMENAGVKALMFVRSSQIQGIHLTSILSEAGFKNVTVYYPTATVQ